MDFFQSHQTVPKPLLSYLLPFSRTFNCTSKTTGWFTKGLKLINLPHANKVLLKGSTRILHWWTSFSRTKLCQTVYLTFFHFPERSIALVKRLAGSPRLKLIPPAYANKVLLQGSTHSYIHWWTSFSRTKLWPKPLLSYLLPFSRTFNCTSKTTGWFTKGLKLIPTCPLLKSVVTQGSTRILMDFFQSQTVPKPLLSYLLPFSERSIALVKRLAGSPKGWNWSTPTLTKCYSR
jgi:hypothetical protein